ncbi:acyl carrier protein [Streptomyces sp. NPDC023838]|uniref:acyl carrier protein n=1 Tax=Streptomyces sp. NPDC023838 TaxID=3154325 RepID=UPI0033C9A2E3
MSGQMAPYDFIVSYLTTGLAVPPTELRPETTFGELELDSIALVELVVTVNDHYAIALDDTELTPNTTLAETANLVTTAQNVNAGALDCDLVQD